MEIRFRLNNLGHNGNTYSKSPVYTAGSRALIDQQSEGHMYHKNLSVLRILSLAVYSLRRLMRYPMLRLGILRSGRNFF